MTGLQAMAGAKMQSSRGGWGFWCAVLRHLATKGFFAVDYNISVNDSEVRIQDPPGRPIVLTRVVV